MGSRSAGSSARLDTWVCDRRDLIRELFRRIAIVVRNFLIYKLKNTNAIPAQAIWWDRYEFDKIGKNSIHSSRNTST